jgi:hypothetical protein
MRMEQHAAVDEQMWSGMGYGRFMMQLVSFKVLAREENIMDSSSRGGG